MASSLGPTAVPPAALPRIVVALISASSRSNGDAARHGIVTSDGGLMNPHHFLAVAIGYLFGHRDGWPAQAAVGKTLVSSSMIDKMTQSLSRTLLEVPVGFKWFVPGLLDGSVAFGGEESAGASFLQRDGSVWMTDKDGILLCLLASEIAAVTGTTPSGHYRDLTAQHGDPAYAWPTPVSTRPRPRAEGGAGQAVARTGPGRYARGREDRRQADPRARQRRPDRRPEGGQRVGTTATSSPGWGRLGSVFAEDEAALLVAAARDAAELDALVQRRVVGTPLEHILGRAQFGGLRIAVDHRVFVPRRRTEFLARQAIELASLITDRGPIVLALRCVSGAIAALVAAELAAAFAAGGLTPRTVGSDEFYATVVIGTAPA